MVGNFGTHGDPNLSPTRGCAVTLGPIGDGSHGQKYVGMGFARQVLTESMQALIACSH